MRSVKHILLGVFVTLCVVGATLYSSCSKDVCKAVNCINGGTCGGGTCFCRDGVGGLNCEVIYRKKYENVYKGSGFDDTGKIYMDNTLSFTSAPDTSYTQMNLFWTNPGGITANFKIKLIENTANGSSFTTDSVVSGSTTYFGVGTVDAVKASLTITVRHDSIKHIITLHNFVKL